MTLQKGHNSTKDDNPDLKSMYQLIFDEESIYEILKLYLKIFEQTNEQTEACTSPKQYAPSTIQMLGA